MESIIYKFEEPVNVVQVSVPVTGNKLNRHYVSFNARGMSEGDEDELPESLQINFWNNSSLKITKPGDKVTAICFEELNESNDIGMTSCPVTCISKVKENTGVYYFTFSGLERRTVYCEMYLELHGDIEGIELGGEYNLILK